jgi:hypothetical protein
LENKEGIIDDLRNQVEFLRDELSKAQEDKNKMIEYYDNCKKNDEKKMVKSCNSNEEVEKFSGNGKVYRIVIEFTISPQDIENNLVILEVCYSLKFKYSYGFYGIYFYEEENIPFSCLCIIDKNFKLESRETQEFTSVSDSEIFIFCQNYINFTLRDKRIKLDIKKELSQNLLSPFSEEEIKLMNFALSEMSIDSLHENMIFHKALHNITDSKDYIKIYYVVFYPCPNGNEGGQGQGGGEEPIIIVKFKINDILLKNTAEDEENNNSNKNKGIYGTYYSNKEFKSFDYNFMGNFAVYELDCESTSNNLFRCDCSDLIDNLNFGTLSPCKYEIKLNGNNLKFVDENFKYEVKNDKIVFQGYIEKYSEEKLIELKKKEDENFDINEIEKEERYYEWKSAKKKGLIPIYMKLDGVEGAEGEEGEEEM